MDQIDMEIQEMLKQIMPRKTEMKIDTKLLLKIIALVTIPYFIVIGIANVIARNIVIPNIIQRNYTSLFEAIIIIFTVFVIYGMVLSGESENEKECKDNDTVGEKSR